MLQNRLRELKAHCLGTSESEKNFLFDAFVMEHEYAEILSSPFGSPILLIGRKGTGKTALLSYMAKVLPEHGVRSLFLRPDDMPLLDNIGSAQEVSTIKRKAYEALISAIATHIGSTLKGLLGRHDKKLFDKATTEGAQSHDSIQACVKALSQFGSSLTQVEFDKLLPQTRDLPVNSLRSSLTHNFERAKSPFFLFIDDIDQVAATISHKDHINRVWGLILAIRKATEELPNVKAVISMRTEIWRQLANVKEGQRDQIDHFRNLVRTLDPDEKRIKEIIQMRLKVVSDKLEISDNTDRLLNFFSTPYVTLPNSQDRRSWEDFLAKSSRGRPRDALQLIAKLCDQSIKGNHELIEDNKAVIEVAVEQYSTERLNDLAREFSHDCNVVTEIVDAFRDRSFIQDSESMRDFLETLPSRYSIKLRGKTLREGNFDHLFALWSFLHETGFINPRIADDRESKGYRHILFDHSPTFVSASNWNEMQKVEWEIHPAFRSYLAKKKLDEEARKGFKAFFKRSKQ